jgi:DNA-directed RNA polymerase subunit RPC12/RpoP
MGDPILTGASSLKAAYDMAKAVLDIHGTVKIEAKVFELQRLILDAQAAEAALAGEKRRLEDRVRELETWDRDKQRYQLEYVGPARALAFGLKPEAKGSEADHKLCADCYNKGQKSYLQPHLIPQGRAQILACGTCGSQILVKGVAETHASKKSP